MHSADAVVQKVWEDLPKPDQVALFSGLGAALDHMTEEELIEALPGFVWDVVRSRQANEVNRMNTEMAISARSENLPFYKAIFEAAAQSKRSY